MDTCVSIHIHAPSPVPDTETPAALHHAISGGPQDASVLGRRILNFWVAVKELIFLGNPRFPFKGSSKGDIDMGRGVNIESGLLLRNLI